MSKNIAISDEVYRRLKQEKGDRSFSEVIAANLDRGGALEDVTGQQVLEPETYEAVASEIAQLSDQTVQRVDDETS